MNCGSGYSDEGVDPHASEEYWNWLAAWSFKHSDGCTGVPDTYAFCCWAHDFGYQTGQDPYQYWKGLQVPQDESCSNTKLRWCMQAESKLGRWNPLSWIRYAGVAVFGRFFYKPKPMDADKKETPAAVAVKVVEDVAKVVVVDTKPNAK
jgi:hypothetical protein